jgi:isoleucyl-tRNA synthetase
MDYKETLNLPKTAFPMKAGLAQREPKRLAAWEGAKLYKIIREKCHGRPIYTIHDGPPYANAAIHLGTSLNKILKDIAVKSKTLSGFDVPYVPGWDCHGLPIELKVEKKVGKPGTKLNHREFRQACRDFAAKQVDIQREDFKRLGVFSEWDNPYLSMNFSYEANEVRALAEIIDKGHLERGQKPVHWCTACGSALAEAEVEYQDKTSPAIDVAFDVIDTKMMLEKFGVSGSIDVIAAPIWTTTPWTLPANQAVSVNANFDYVLVKCRIEGHERNLVLARELLDSVLARYAVDDYETLGEAKGEDLAGLLLQHPFLERKVPIILGDHVTAEAGTGNVHTAPAHGLDDYIMGQKYNLPQDCPVDSRSCFVEGTPIVAGMHVFKANEPIIEALRESQHLLHFEEFSHSYPHCWRHKKPLIFRATPQWFISMEKNGLRAQAMQSIKDSKWLPSWGVKRITSMMESRPDWCISRQRTWGVPITLFIHKQTNEVHPDTPQLMQKIADIIEKEGIDAWYDVDATSLIDDADDYDKVTDTLDVWFDSGVTHYCVLEKRQHLKVPADLYLEGSDQHRGWFQTSLLTGVAMRGEAPFKTVLTHGYVVDSKGHKMSKSVGNTIAPKDVVNKLGADVLRLWVSSSDFTGDIKVSDEIFKRCSDAYRRIRNTARFLLSNLNDFNVEKDLLPQNKLVALDQWAVVAARDLQQKIIAAYDEFNFQSIYQMIHNFCSVEMGSFYLDIVKDRLYTAKSDGQARRSAQTAMYHVLEAMVRWLAPILSFTADEIWECMPGERAQGGLFYDKWYQGFNDYKLSSDIDWPQLMKVRDEVNKVLESRRQTGDIGSALDANVTLYAEKQLQNQLAALSDELRFMLITSGAHVESISQANGEAVTTDIAMLQVKVAVSEAEKCERCWQRSSDVGTLTDHKTICGRCVENITGQGESRHFA